MILYFDSSALVKLFLREPGTETVRELWDGAADRVTSVASYPETRSALAAAVRSGRIEPTSEGAVVSELDLRYETMAVVVLDEDLAVTAGRLAQRHSLRGYDAVHLASALSVGDDPALMVTWNAELARAAAEAGLPVTSD